MTTCPECGETFGASHKLRLFCKPEHKRAFFNLMVKRATLLPLALTARKRTKHAKGGDSELSSYARRQRDALVDAWNREDKIAGRDTSLIVARKMASMWSAADLAPTETAPRPL